MTSKRGWLWFGFVVFVLVLAMALAVASVAVARPDYYGGAPSAAPYTTTDGTGRALDFWPAYEDWVNQYAPYTEQPYAGTTNIAPHVPESQVKPFAPYTEKYAGTDNIGPHVPSNLIEGPSAPFTEPKPFWGQYLER